MNNTLLTIILPTYNGERHIEEAICSILNQTLSDFELLILDDCSTDGTWNLIKKFGDPRIHMHRNVVNLGLPSNMNIGISMARGEFLARIDQDDLARHDRFEQQVRFLQNNPDVTIVGSQVEHFDEEFLGCSNLPLDDQIIKGRLVSGNNYFANQSSMGRVAFYRSHRLHFDPNLYVVDDLGFWFDCMLCGANFANLPEPLTRYRIHKGMTSMNLNVNRLNASKSRLYRRLLPAFFPLVDGDSIERLLTFYQLGAPVSRQWYEMVELHRIVGQAVRRVDVRWGQSTAESSNCLLGFLNTARDASVLEKTITAEDCSKLSSIFQRAQEA